MSSHVFFTLLMGRQEAMEWHSQLMAILSAFLHCPPQSGNFERTCLPWSFIGQMSVPSSKLEGRVERKSRVEGRTQEMRSIFFGKRHDDICIDIAVRGIPSADKNSISCLFNQQLQDKDIFFSSLRLQVHVVDWSCSTAWEDALPLIQWLQRFQQSWSPVLVADFQIELWLSGKPTCLVCIYDRVGKVGSRLPTNFSKTLRFQKPPS